MKLTCGSCAAHVPLASRDRAAHVPLSLRLRAALAPLACRSRTACTCRERVAHGSGQNMYKPTCFKDAAATGRLPVTMQRLRTHGMARRSKAELKCCRGRPSPTSLSADVAHPYESVPAFRSEWRLSHLVGGPKRQVGAARVERMSHIGAPSFTRTSVSPPAPLGTGVLLRFVRLLLRDSAKGSVATTRQASL